MTSSYQLKQEQERLERDSIQRGIDRYVNNLEREDARGRAMDSPVVDKILRKVIRKIIPDMVALQERGLQHNREVVAKGGQEYTWGWRVNLVCAEALAYIVVKTIVGTRHGAASLQHHATRIGHTVQCEYWWSEARRLERARTKDTGEFNRIDLLKRTVREIKPKTIRKWMRKLDDLGIQAWSAQDRAQVGAVLLDAVLPHMGDIFEVRVVRTKKGTAHRMESKVVIKDEFLELLQEQHMASAMCRPWLLPMVTPPIEWTMVDGEMRGGYRTLNANHNLLFLRGGYTREGHTNVDDVPEEYLQALNRMQGTPWEVNTDILGHVLDAFQRDDGPLPYEAQKLMPPKVSKEIWDLLGPADRKKVIAARASIHDHNNHHHNKKQTALRAVMVAEEFAKYDCIYFPHSIDWRGRAYPIPQDLHPQGPDMVKAMLRFGEGKPLGERGLVWLECHVASSYGLDKQDRLTQQMWVQENWADLNCLAVDPWSVLEFWMAAEEPWQFLAGAVELHNAHQGPGAPEDYVSHLPISLDGSCNGLQHLSAMGRDPVGAKAVNLTPGPRQDIYQIVADKVIGGVQGSPWEGHVTRKTVKRGVMTTPYGVTPRGMATQLKKDGFTRCLEGDELRNANYLRDHMVKAIDDTIVKGKQIMGWMQDCAQIAAAHQQGLAWVTPLGLKVTQYYSRPVGSQVRTVLGRLTLNRTGADAPIDKMKQKNSVAPNIIHSFDAAHMMMVVLSMPEGTSFAMVHDSFGCHACDVDMMLEVTKDTFIAIYKEDWFEMLYADFRFFTRNLELPEPPPLGDLDIHKVYDSEYFFA